MGLSLGVNASIPSPGTSIGDEQARLELSGTDFVLLDRRLRTAEFRLERDVDDQEVVHPLLTSAAIVFAHWHGDEAFHAGCFVAGEGAWALVGENEAGKSSTLACLAAAGHPVLCDDLLVVRDGNALAGPRCLDLRQDAADALGTEGSLRAVRLGRRGRLLLPEVQPEVPLRGVLFVAWGAEAALEPVSPGDRVRRLAGQRALTIPPESGIGLLELARLSAWEWRRPRGWDRIEAEVEELVRRLAG